MRSARIKGLSDEALMEEFQIEKDVKVFEEIYQRHFSALTKYLLWFTGDLERSKDLAQNIFIKLLDQPHLFDASKNFKVWIFSIAKNKWKNDLRRISTKMKFEKKLKVVEENKQVIAENDLNKLRLQRVKKAVNSLPENHREVIVLKYTNNFTIEEIAQILECSKGTVKSRLFYAIKNLKKTPPYEF